MRHRLVEAFLRYLRRWKKGLMNAVGYSLKKVRAFPSRKDSRMLIMAWIDVKSAPILMALLVSTNRFAPYISHYQI